MLRRPIVVLGMHRSGTSMVSGALVRAGAYPGEARDLLEDQDDNPLGFWERRDVVALNDQLLESQNSSWLLPKDQGSWSIAEHEVATQFSEAAEGILSQLGTDVGRYLAQIPPENAHVGNTDVRSTIVGRAHVGAEQTSNSDKVDLSSITVLIKDPRLCLTWDHWAPLLENPFIVYVYRSPIAVARSLQRRNHFPLRLGFDLWEVYNAQCLDILNQFGGVAVSFDGIQTSPKQQLGDLLHLLTGEGVALDPDNDFTGFDPSLPKPIDDQLLSLCTAHQQRLSDWADTELLASPKIYRPGQLPQFAVDGGVYERISDLGSVVEPLADANETRAELSRRLEESVLHQRERDAALAQLASTEADYKALTQRHDAHVEQHAALVKTLDQRESEFSDLAVRLERETDEKQQALSELSTRAKVFDSLAAAHADEVERHANLYEQYQHLEERFAQGQADNLALHSTLDTVRGQLDSANSDLAALTEKSDWLFDTLTREYGRLLQYERSFLGNLQRIITRAYRLLTNRRGQATAYEQALAEARVFYRDHQLEAPRPSPKKANQIGAMARYTVAHPVSALRSVSLPRLRKVLSVVKDSDAEDLQVWVDARFPEAQPTDLAPATNPPSPEEVLAFPETNHPLVTILIPVYNEWVVTHRCLWSILKHTKVPYEVIVADDCSTDETRDIHQFVTGVRVVRHSENKRFLLNCNVAAQEARGEFLLLLNNDTTVTEGWLEPLLAQFTDPAVGIVGPRLMFPNGKLQEAGGIVWSDASGWNFGRADDPRQPQYNYVREVDYVSGAALMIRMSLWQRLGGFDERFTPAYYEDTDICFQAREAGYRVICQPASVVVHYEGLTNGTDLGSGQKQYQVVNQQTFREKWARTLEKEHFPNAEHVNLARDRSRQRRTLLIIDHYVPHYDKDAGSRSTWGYIKLFIEEGYRVQFMGANFFPHAPYTEQLQQLGVEVLVGERLARNLDRWFRENLPYVDHIFLHRPHIAEQFLPHLTKYADCPPISFVGHDLHFLRTQREFDVTQNPAVRDEGERWLKRELSVIKSVQHSLYFSKIETDALNELVPEADVRSIPLYVLEAAEVDPITTEIPELLFIAGFNHPPNIDAAVWFVTEIFPAIREALPGIRLNIAGSNPSKAVQELGCADVTVHGYVTDSELRTLYATARCAVVPLRFGAGVKGKVLEAIQHGVPLVTTSVGAEGIPNPERVMRIADSPGEFAKNVVDVVSDDPDHEADRRQWLAEHFSADTAINAINALVGGPLRAGDPRSQ